MFLAFLTDHKFLSIGRGSEGHCVHFYFWAANPSLPSSTRALEKEILKHAISHERRTLTIEEKKEMKKKDAQTIDRLA